MIISSRQRSRSPLGRLLAIFRGASLQVNAAILDEQQFLFELTKERARVDRRIEDSEFALIDIVWPNGTPIDLIPMANDIRQRLRITDSVGWRDHQITILLPETSRDGATHVANDIVKIAMDHDQKVDAEILIYPWDDYIAQGANELDSNFIETVDDGQHTTYSDPRTMDSRHLQPFSATPSTPLWKRMTDVVIAGCGLILLSPVFFMAAIAIKVNSQGPVFFRQQREGKDGVPFGIIKLRTMVLDAEERKDSLRHHSEQDGPAFKLGDDPRVTQVGRYLRRTCIDELPQLINVLLGDMSLVGPRPLPVDESANCETWQRKRLEVLPGITGIWQIYGGRDTQFSDWMRMDLLYLRRRSFFYDLRLIMRTAFVALLHRGSV